MRLQQSSKCIVLFLWFALKSIRGRQRAEPEQGKVTGSTSQVEGWWRRQGSGGTSTITTSRVRIVVDVVVREAAAAAVLAAR